MNGQDYSTLAYLARAIASRPNAAEDYLAVARGEVEGAALELGHSAELQHALAAIRDAWDAQRQQEQRTLTLHDVVSIALQLEQRASDVERLAGSALRSASRETLLRRRRGPGLTPDELELAAAELPAAAG